MASVSEPIPVTSQKHDPAWKHCEMFKNGDRVQLKCIYCSKIFKGGGIHRIKEHLAGQKGNASSCLQVQPEIRLLMQQSLEGVVVKKKRKQKLAEEITNVNPTTEINTFVDQTDVSTTGLHLVHDTTEPSSSFLVIPNDEPNYKSSNRRKRGRMKKHSSSTNISNSIPVSRIAMGSKRASNEVHMAIGRFFYDVGLSVEAVNSSYFQPMFDAIASQGLEVSPPSYHDLQGWVLRNSLEELKVETDQYRANWGRTGCSILVEELKTAKGNIFVNIFAYGHEGTMFLKSVDISDVANPSDVVYEWLKEVIEGIGLENVIQVITSYEEKYVIAGKKLASIFSTLYWVPCASQCVDLMLQDFEKLELIQAIITQAKYVTRYIYNCSFILNMMRRYTFGNDIIAIGITRSATNFTLLKRLFGLRNNLQSMVTSEEWMECPYSKKSGGLAILDVISDQSFWSSCSLIINLTDPLLRVLRIVNSERRPGMGYVYAEIYRAKQIIKKEFLNKKDYLVYWNIIDQKWEQQQHFPLHAAGFYLNPKFFYSIQGDVHNEVISGMLDCIERLVPDINTQDKIIKELNSYKNAAADFGRKMAIRARNTLLPSEWWSTYGGGCPNLARLAVRILSQTCSLIGSPRKHIPLEDQLHDTKNSIENRRLNDLLHVHYNLQLRQMHWKHANRNCYDPISCESISAVEEWVIEHEDFSEEIRSADWMAVDPPLTNTMILGASNDEIEDFDTGFDDFEIFGVKDCEGETVEENGISQLEEAM